MYLNHETWRANVMIQQARINEKEYARQALEDAVRQEWLAAIREQTRLFTIIAKALDVIASAVADEHDWKYEDRMNRTIDDLPPAIIVESKPTDTKGPTE